jgi:DNA-binding transcriptional LysR family regulator
MGCSCFYDDPPKVEPKAADAETEVERLRDVLENVKAELGIGTSPHVAMRIIRRELAESRKRHPSTHVADKER